MSKSTRQRWHADSRGLNIYDEDGTIVVHLVETCEDCRRIVADHNACIGIEDPKTTIPELVAAGNTILAGPVDEPRVELTGEYQTGLYCGLEDCGAHEDGYAGCDYGFEQGVTRTLEWAQGVIAAVLAKMKGP